MSNSVCVSLAQAKSLVSGLSATTSSQYGESVKNAGFRGLELSKGSSLLVQNSTNIPVAAKFESLTKLSVVAKFTSALSVFRSGLEADFESASNVNPALANKIKEGFAMFSSENFNSQFELAISKIGSSDIFEEISFLKDNPKKVTLNDYSELCKVINGTLGSLHSLAYMVAFAVSGVPMSYFTPRKLSTLLLTDKVNLFGQVDIDIPNSYRTFNVMNNNTCDKVVVSLLRCEAQYMAYSQVITNIARDCFVYGASEQGIQNYTEYGNNTTLLQSITVDNKNGSVTLSGFTPFNGENQFDNSKNKKPKADSVLTSTVANKLAMGQQISSVMFYLSDFVFNDGAFFASKCNLSQDEIELHKQAASDIFYNNFFKEITENSKRVTFGAVGSFSVTSDNGDISFAFLDSSANVGLKFHIDSFGLTASGLSLFFSSLINDKESDISNISVSSLDMSYRTSSEAKILIFFKTILENKGKALNNNVKASDEEVVTGEALLDELFNF